MSIRIRAHVSLQGVVAIGQVWKWDGGYEVPFGTP